MGEFSLWHWAIVLLIVIMIFGTKRLRNVGSDLGTAIRQFKKSMNEAEAEPASTPIQHRPEAQASAQVTNPADKVH